MRYPGTRAEDWSDVRGPVDLLGRRIGRAFQDQLTSGPNPFGALGLDRLARDVGPRSKVPTIIKVKQINLCV